MGTAIIVRRDSSGTIVTLMDDGTAGSPSVSPDGSKIAYAGTKPGFNSGRRTIWAMNSDGSGSVNLDPEPPYDPEGTYWDDLAVRWSHDGTKISVSRITYYWNQDPPTRDIMVMDADASNATTITTDHISMGPASWSPDDSRLVYSTMYGHLYIVDADGSNGHEVSTDTTHQPYNPTWAPDGNRIYFDTTVYGIFYFSSTDAFTTTLSSDGTQLTSTGGSNTDELPEVSSDGQTVYFDSNNYSPNLGTEIFSVSASGGTPTRLTTTGYHQEVSLVRSTYPAAPPSNATVSLGAPAPSDNYGERQITIGLSSSGVSKFQYGWSSSNSTAPNTSYLQESTDLTNKKGTLNFLGKYSGSGTTWNGGTQPNEDWYLWVRSVQTGGTPNSWGTPLKVRTPRAGAWVAIGDSYSSGHHQDDDQPLCPDANDPFWGTYAQCTTSGAPDYSPNDASFSWVATAVASFNSNRHLPTAWQMTLGPTDSNGMPAYLAARSGKPTSAFGASGETPGTLAWATLDTEAGALRSGLYARYDSWNIVSVTGGANDTSWSDKFKTWYLAHPLATPEPWQITTTNPAADCPDSNAVYTELGTNQSDGHTLNWHITTNLQGVVDLAAELSPGVRVANVGYPYVMDANDSTVSRNDCSANSGSWHGATSVVDLLNADHNGVNGDNVQYVDLTASAVLGADPVAGGYVQKTRLYGYPHATASGQSQIASKAVAVLTGSGW